MKLDALKELLQKRTPGKWESGNGAVWVMNEPGNSPDSICEYAEYVDAALIAAAINALPSLIAVAEAAKEVARFTEPEWRDDIDRGDADIALREALTALEA